MYFNYAIGEAIEIQLKVISTGIHYHLAFEQKDSALGWPCWICLLTLRNKICEHLAIKIRISANTIKTHRTRLYDTVGSEISPNIDANIFF